MCTGFEGAALAMMLGSTALTVHQSNETSRANEKLTNQSAENASIEAKSAAAVAANRAEAQGRKRAAQSRAAMAGAGVNVGGRTAEKINEEIMSDAIQNGIQGVNDANDRGTKLRFAAQVEGFNQSRQRQQTTLAGATQAGDTVLSGFDNTGKWVGINRNG